ncbi:MAG: glycyl-radical enzyme activating protein [Clostridia bacterium]|nr:glycyl-radical enzyme activating protein [Clostridia bacterium]
MSHKSIELTRGRIFDIQRFSLHDGQGIRTIVFLKGCPLRCRWCCNPEGQDWEAHRMKMPGKPERLMGKDVTAAEVMETVMRDMPYYARSGGGLTLSGGEALGQPDFARALLLLAHNAGINTCIETTGYAPREVLLAVLPHVDTVLMDIKHMSPEKHEAYTGKRNDLILENAQFIAEQTKELIIRVPVIPTFNDTEGEIRAIAAFARTLPGVRRLHLLPYHRLGQDKYDALGREYSMRGIPPIPDERMRYLLSVAEESGLICQIGG